MKTRNIFMIMLLCSVLLITSCTNTPNKIDSLDQETEKDNMENTQDETMEQDTEKENIQEQATNEHNEEESKTEAPDFTLSDGKGNEYSLSDYKGKLVLVNFFTTWCVYCEEEMPYFQKIYEKYKDEDVAILAVDVQHDAKEKSIEEVLKWVEERNLTFPVVFDEDKTATSKYFISGYPTTYVIDKEGYVIGYVNAMNEEMLEKLISMYR
jgi:cytochrome c-type biogenesis protein